MRSHFTIDSQGFVDSITDAFTSGDTKSIAKAMEQASKEVTKLLGSSSGANSDKLKEAQKILQEGFSKLQNGASPADVSKTFAKFATLF